MNEIERTLLLNQYKILKLLESTNNYQKEIAILEDGQEYFYHEALTNLPTINRSVTSFVFDLFDFYRHVENLKSSNTSSVLHNNNYSYFQGFDANNEPDFYQTAIFIVEEMDLYSEQKDFYAKNDKMNSHTQIKSKYEALLNDIKTYQASNRSLHTLTDTDIDGILNRHFP